MEAKSRFRQWIIIVLISIGTIFTFWVVLTLGRLCYESVVIGRPKDSSQIDVLDVQYANEGMLLDVHASNRIAEVYKQHERCINPYKRMHYRVPFGVLDSEEEKNITIIVDYKFHPESEWLLAIKTADGYWWMGSPYFPKEPNVLDEEWERLRAASRRVSVEKATNK